MKLYAYRFTNDEGVPTGYYGVVAANSEHDLFGNIDIWRGPLLSVINKTFNTKARSLIYIYE